MPGTIVTYKDKKTGRKIRATKDEDGNLTVKGQRVTPTKDQILQKKSCGYKKEGYLKKEGSYLMKKGGMRPSVLDKCCNYK